MEEELEQEKSPRETPEDKPDSTTTPRSEIFHAQGEDIWEWWARASVLLAALTALAHVVVLFKAGSVSVMAYSAFIPLMTFVSLPIIFWGLWVSMTRPPVMRPKRTFAFLLLLAVAYVGSNPILPVPVSTENFRSKYSYRLPFDGPWYTMAGGEDRDRNYYATAPSVRWAYAFTKLGPDKKRFKDEGKKLEDYYCYGQPILSPVDGKVVDMITGQDDMKPGTQDQTNWLGNHVILLVDRDEYLFVSHLKKDTIKLKVDQEIKAGEKLGECGNSGFSAEPHLTIHLQNGPKYPYAEGLPLFFDRYRVDGKLVERGTPLGATDPDEMDGQIVQNQ